ncbi:MAG: hypothetical protein IPM13_03855 [Phycisphaerales bacterium]|nr:hypothetical protein [Phycisphaerales bacterium]
MRRTAKRVAALDKLVAALQHGICDEAAARELYALGPEAVTLALLAAPRPAGRTSRTRVAAPPRYTPRRGSRAVRPRD